MIRRHLKVAFIVALLLLACITERLGAKDVDDEEKKGQPQQEHPNGDGDYESDGSIQSSDYDDDSQQSQSGQPPGAVSVEPGVDQSATSEGSLEVQGSSEAWIVPEDGSDNQPPPHEEQDSASVEPDTYDQSATSEASLEVQSSAAAAAAEPEMVKQEMDPNTAADNNQHQEPSTEALVGQLASSEPAVLHPDNVTSMVQSILPSQPITETVADTAAPSETTPSAGKTIFEEPSPPPGPKSSPFAQKTIDEIVEELAYGIEFARQLYVKLKERVKSIPSHMMNQKNYKQRKMKVKSRVLKYYRDWINLFNSFTKACRMWKPEDLLPPSKYDDIEQFADELSTLKSTVKEADSIELSSEWKQICLMHPRATQYGWMFGTIEVSLKKYPMKKKKEGSTSHGKILSSGWWALYHLKNKLSDFEISYEKRLYRNDEKADAPTQTEIAAIYKDIRAVREAVIKLPRVKDIVPQDKAIPLPTGEGCCWSCLLKMRPWFCKRDLGLLLGTAGFLGAFIALCKFVPEYWPQITQLWHSAPEVHHSNMSTTEEDTSTMSIMFEESINWSLVSQGIVVLVFFLLCIISAAFWYTREVRRRTMTKTAKTKSPRMPRSIGGGKITSSKKRQLTREISRNVKVALEQGKWVSSSVMGPTTTTTPSGRGSASRKGSLRLN